MKRSMRIMASVLACSAATFGAVSPAWAGTERVDPGEDFHWLNKDEVVVHQEARFNLFNFEKYFEVDRFELRRLNPEATIAVCVIDGKLAVDESVNGMERRLSTQIWEDCPTENRLIHIVTGATIRLRGEPRPLVLNELSLPPPRLDVPPAPRVYDADAESEDKAPAVSDEEIKAKEAEITRRETEASEAVSAAEGAASKLQSDIVALKGEFSSLKAEVKNLRESRSVLYWVIAALGFLVLLFGALWLKARSVQRKRDLNADKAAQHDELLERLHAMQAIIDNKDEQIRIVSGERDAAVNQLEKQPPSTNNLGKTLPIPNASQRVKEVEEENARLRQVVARLERENGIKATELEGVRTEKGKVDQDLVWHKDALSEQAERAKNLQALYDELRSSYDARTKEAADLEDRLDRKDAEIKRAKEAVPPKVVAMLGRISETVYEIWPMLFGEVPDEDTKRLKPEILIRVLKEDLKVRILAFREKVQSLYRSIRQSPDEALPEDVLDLLVLEQFKAKLEKFYAEAEAANTGIPREISSPDERTSTQESAQFAAVSGLEAEEIDGALSVLGPSVEKTDQAGAEDALADTEPPSEKPEATAGAKPSDAMASTSYQPLHSRPAAISDRDAFALKRDPDGLVVRSEGKGEVPDVTDDDVEFALNVQLDAKPGTYGVGQAPDIDEDQADRLSDYAVESLRVPQGRVTEGEGRVPTIPPDAIDAAVDSLMPRVTSDEESAPPSSESERVTVVAEEAEDRETLVREDEPVPVTHRSGSHRLSEIRQAIAENETSAGDEGMPQSTPQAHADSPLTRSLLELADEQKSEGDASGTKAEDASEAEERPDRDKSVVVARADVIPEEVPKDLTPHPATVRYPHHSSPPSARRASMKTTLHGMAAVQAEAFSFSEREELFGIVAWLGESHDEVAFQLTSTLEQSLFDHISRLHVRVGTDMALLYELANPKRLETLQRALGSDTDVASGELPIPENRDHIIGVIEASVKRVNQEHPLQIRSSVELDLLRRFVHMLVEYEHQNLHLYEINRKEGA